MTDDIFCTLYMITCAPCVVYIGYCTLYMITCAPCVVLYIGYCTLYMIKCAPCVVLVSSVDHPVTTRAKGDAG